MASSKKVSEKSGSESNTFASKKWRNLYLDKRTADMYFVCGIEKERIPAHKLVFSQTNPVFFNMYCEKSDANGVLELRIPQVSPNQFKEYLKLIYTDDVTFLAFSIMEVLGLSDIYRMPNEPETFEASIQIVQHVPKNICDELDNNSIQRILRKIPNVRDYLNVAKTCDKFQDNAIAAYPTRFTSLRISNSEQGDNVLRENEVKEYLRIFVDNQNGPTNYEMDDNTLVSIENVSFGEYMILNFYINSKLISLTFDKNTKFDMIHHFPNLIECGFYEHGLTTEEIAEFLVYNPQLKRLVVAEMASPRIFKYIGNCGENLESLEILCEIYENSDDLIELCKLKHLKTFKFGNFSGEAVPLNQLLEGFANNDVRIENLELLSHDYMLYNWSDIRSITKLKFLEKLHIQNISQQQMIYIDCNLPELKEFNVHVPH